MTRPQFFIISSAIIFFLERVLPALTSWSVFIFPVFVILFALLSSGNVLADLSYIVVAAVFFDFFSGFTFGLLTFAILAVFITIYLARIFFNVDGKSPISLLVVSFIFIFEYFLLLSIKTSPRILVSQAFVILAETVVLLIFMRAIFRKSISRPGSNFAG